MNLFQNGHRYSTAIPLPPPTGRKLPSIKVEMAGEVGVFQPVTGKLDTGAFMTILTFSTAGVLGIADPKANPLRQGTAHTAKDESFDYYVHSVVVRVATQTGPDLHFHLKAGFAADVQRDLFGIDWLDSLCVAIDREQVHLLRD